MKSESQPEFDGEFRVCTKFHLSRERNSTAPFMVLRSAAHRQATYSVLCYNKRGWHPVAFCHGLGSSLSRPSPHKPLHELVHNLSMLPVTPLYPIFTSTIDPVFTRSTHSYYQLVHFQIHFTSYSPSFFSRIHTISS